MNSLFLILNFKYINKYNINSLFSVLDILHIFAYHMHYVYNLNLNEKFRFPINA